VSDGGSEHAAGRLPRRYDMQRGGEKRRARSVREGNPDGAARTCSVYAGTDDGQQIVTRCNGLAGRVGRAGQWAL
jgi:hypothetical protein